MTEIGMEHLFSWTENLTFYVRFVFAVLAFTQCLASEHYTIYREIQAGSPKDTFKLPTSLCELQAKCRSFKAKKAKISCECSCGLNDGKRSTFGFYNGAWSCAHDGALRMHEGM